MATPISVSRTITTVVSVTSVVSCLIPYTCRSSWLSVPLLPQSATTTLGTSVQKCGYSNICLTCGVWNPRTCCPLDHDTCIVEAITANGGSYMVVIGKLLNIDRKHLVNNACMHFIGLTTTVQPIKTAHYHASRHFICSRLSSLPLGVQPSILLDWS